MTVPCKYTAIHNVMNIIQRKCIEPFFYLHFYLSNFPLANDTSITLSSPS